jgi:RimJ/RimL family protein N-acetyltransferase
MPQRTEGPAVPVPPGPADRDRGDLSPAGPLPFPPEQVDGGVVMLRRVQIEDAAGIALAVAVSLDHLRPWMPWATPEAASPRTQMTRVAEADELWETGTDFIYSLLPVPGPPGAGEVVAGQVGLHRRAGEGAIEIGYWVAATHVRRGLGTAATRVMTPVALSLPGVNRVEIHCDEANTASAAIPRRLGYRLDRIAPHEPEAPGECGQRMIWVKEAGQPAAASSAGAAR